MKPEETFIIREQLETLGLNHYVEILLSPNLRQDKLYEYIVIPVLDILRFHPLFIKTVADTRSKLSINPNKIKKQLSTFFGKEKLVAYLTTLEYLKMGKSFEDKTLDVYDEAITTILDWSQLHFPTLETHIQELRLKHFHNIPTIYQDAITLYVLLDITASLSVYSINIEQQQLKIYELCDVKTKAHFLQLNVYPETDITALKSTLLNKRQRHLQSFYRQKTIDTLILLRRLFYYVLRKNLKLNHDDALEVLVHLHLDFKSHNTISLENSAQELRRFEDIFSH